MFSKRELAALEALGLSDLLASDDVDLYRSAGGALHMTPSCTLSPRDLPHVPVRVGMADVTPDCWCIGPANFRARYFRSVRSSLRNILGLAELTEQARTCDLTDVAACRRLDEFAMSRFSHRQLRAVEPDELISDPVTPDELSTVEADASVELTGVLGRVHAGASIHRLAAAAISVRVRDEVRALYQSAAWNNGRALAQMLMRWEWELRDGSSPEKRRRAIVGAVPAIAADARMDRAVAGRLTKLWLADTETLYERYSAEFYAAPVRLAVYGRSSRGVAVEPFIVKASSSNSTLCAVPDWARREAARRGEMPVRVASNPIAPAAVPAAAALWEPSFDCTFNDLDELTSAAEALT